MTSTKLEDYKTCGTFAIDGGFLSIAEVEGQRIVIFRDADMQVHRDGAAAVIYPDGSKEYYQHGVLVKDVR